MTSTPPPSSMSQTQFNWHEIIDNPLTSFTKMDNNTKAVVTDEQFDDYKEKYEVMKTHANSDLRQAKKFFQEMEDLAIKLFGRGSKQARYISRQTDYDLTGTTVANHYVKFLSPKDIKQQIEIAKGKVSSSNEQSESTSVNIDENNIKNIDKAIKYLTQEGYSYGKDFTSINAVALAKVQGMESIMHTLKGADCNSCITEQDENGMSDDFIAEAKASNAFSMNVGLSFGSRKANRFDSQLRVRNSPIACFRTCEQECYHEHFTVDFEENESSGIVFPKAVKIKGERE